MSKLAKKFLFGLSSIQLIVLLFSAYLNSNFIQRYFLYQEKQDLNRICDEIIRGSDLAETINKIEEENDVIIAWIDNDDNNDLLNEQLREAFFAKGVSMGGYGNFWLWEKDHQEAVEKGRKLRIYHHEKLHYSLLVQYIGLDDNFIAMAKIIPAMERTISLINVVSACVFSASALVMILLVFFLVKKITTPLVLIGETAKAIAHLDFKTVKVKTGDELEFLAEDINNMSNKLKTAHRDLETKNQQMESLLANVSHDLKTPVSLIKAYTSGIKDGIDDGTFLDVIILQNEKMEKMIERLLDLAQMQQMQTVMEPVHLSDCLYDTLAQYRIQAKDRGLLFLCQIESDIVLNSEKAAVQTIFENLISNAVKYTYGNTILLSLRRQENVILFEIENEIRCDLDIDTDRLWEPFYVAEKSRNKNISGTGLGLSIVKAAAQKYGYICFYKLSEQMIRFTIQF